MKSDLQNIMSGSVSSTCPLHQGQPFGSAPSEYFTLVATVTSHLADVVVRIVIYVSVTLLHKKAFCILVFNVCYKMKY